MERYQYAEETVNRKPLLAVGSMVDLSSKKQHGALPLLAVVTGRFGEGLRLARLQGSRWGWEDDQDVALHLEVVNPEMREEESVWKSNVLPITQVKAVSFLTPNKRYRWLLVLKSTSLTILEPQYHATPVVGGLMDELEHSQLSFVKPNPLYTLDSSRTGGNAHSDVSLNPCGPRGNPLLVIMDECGYWSTWNILGISQVDKSTIRLTPYQCGHMMHGVMDMLPAEPAYPAETHGVLHLHFEPAFRPDNEKPNLQHLDMDMPSGHIMMWNAHDWDVLDLENNVGLPKTQPKPELVLRERGRPDRILDVQRSSVNKAHLFVLTSRRLIWLKFVESDRVRKSNMILHVAHIGKENEDMRMSVARARQDDADTSLVLTYSLKKKQLCVYWFGFSSKERLPEWKRHVAVFPGRMKISTRSEIQQLQVEAVKLVNKTRERKSVGPGSKYMEHGVDFYQINMLGGNLDVWLCVCAASKDPALKISFPAPRDEWSEQQRLSKRRRTDFLECMADRFVVPDAMDDDCMSLVSLPTVSGEGYRDSLSPDLPRYIIKRFTDEERKYVLELVKGPPDCRIPVAEVEAVYDALRNGQLAGWLPLMTWADIVNGLPEPIPDPATEDGIDEAVDRLLELCDDKTFVAQLEPQKGEAISTPSLSFSTADQHLFSFSTVEHELSELFLEPWTHSRTQEERQIRTDWVRDLARDMFLSGHGVLVQDVPLFGEEDVLIEDEVVMKPSQTPRMFSSLPATPKSSSSESSSSKAKSSEPLDNALRRLRIFMPMLTTRVRGTYPRSKMLRYWPSHRGADDILDYTYSVDRRDKFWHIKERTRRKKDKIRARAEKYRLPAMRLPLRPLGVDAMSSPPPVLASSQVSAPPRIATMSQPVAGPFGNRKARKGMKMGGFR